MRLPLLFPSAWACLLLLSSAPAAVDAKFTEDFKRTFDDSLAALVPHPTDLYFTPDGEWLFVTSKDGRIWRINVDEMDSGKGTTEPKLLFQIPHKICLNGARGLGGIAVHPNYPATPWIYVYHNHDKYDDCSVNKERDAGPVNRMSRWTLTDSLDGVDPNSEKVFFETPRLNTQTHNSGDIAFGKDGYVYVTVGEGGTKKTKNAKGELFPQALDVMLGVVVRLTDEGEVPDTNPYTPAMGDSKAVRCNSNGQSDDPDKRCQEIYATGLRNPFRFAMDPNADETRFFVNNVGSNTWEMVYEGGDAYAGANYGYPLREGPCEAGKDEDCEPDDKYVDPVHWYHHTEDHGGAITGASFVPDDSGWPSDFHRAYLYAEFANDGIYMISPGGEGCPYPKCDPPTSDYMPTEKMFSDNRKIVGLQFGPHKGGKALYYLTHYPGGNGEEAVYRISYTAGSNRNPKPQIVANPTLGFAPLSVTFDGSMSEDPDGDKLTYEWDFDGDGVVDSTDRQPVFEYAKSGVYWAKLTVQDGNGGSDVTSVRIDVDNTPPKPVIESPAPGTTFAVGDPIILKGSAFDPEDGQIPDMSLTWEVRQHHNTHYHPYLDPTPGNNIRIDDAPEPEDFDASLTSYLAIHLTATDSAGLSMSTVVTIQPRVVNLVFDSEPSGMELLINADKYVTPANIITWENHEFDVEALPQTKDKTSFGIKSWSDGARGKVHKFVTPSTDPDKPLVAKFKMLPPVPRIESPVPGSTFSVDSKLELVGAAMDGAGNALPDSALTWEVHYRSRENRKHKHQFLEPTQGNNIQIGGRSKLKPQDLTTAEQTYLEIVLTVTDAAGLSKTTSMDLEPRKVGVDFNTRPPGLEVVLDGETFKTPVTITTWENHKFNIRTNSQPLDGAIYKFKKWSDGGKRSHRYKVTPAEDRVTASFELAMREPEIVGIEDGSMFAAGDKIVLQGSGTDKKGNAMDDSSLVWEVRLYNEVEDKDRVILKPTKGNGIEIDAPQPLTFYEAEQSYLEILLTTTDSVTGVSSTKSLVMEPKMVDVVFQTKPGGLYVIANGNRFKTPVEVTTWENHRFVIEAPPQRRANITYAWHKWTDGGAASHEYVVPAAKTRNKPHTIGATFNEYQPKEPAVKMGSTLFYALVGAGAAVFMCLVIVLVVLRRKMKGIVVIDMNDMDDDEDSKKFAEGNLSDADSTLKDGSQEDYELSPDGTIKFPSQVESSLASVGEYSTNSKMGFPTPINLSKYLFNNSGRDDSGSLEGTMSITRDDTEEIISAEATDPPIHNDALAEAGLLTDVPLGGTDKELDISVDGSESTRSEF